MIKSKTYAKFLDKEENKTKCRSKQSAGDTLQRVRHNTDERIDSSIVDDHDLWLALLPPDENCGDLSIGTIETTLLRITGCQLFINYLNNILIDFEINEISIFESYVCRNIWTGRTGRELRGCIRPDNYQSVDTASLDHYLHLIFHSNICQFVSTLFTLNFC